MTANQPYSMSMNFQHMWDIPDLRGKYPISTPCKGSLLDFISSHPDFKIFNFMVKRAQMEDIFNQKQANFTLFIPSDKALSLKDNEDVFTNMDILTAKTIVKASSLNNRIPSEILEDSPNSWYYTMSEQNRLCITNVSGQTYINGDIKILYKDILATNGIIHVTDNVIILFHLLLRFQFLYQVEIEG